MHHLLCSKKRRWVPHLPYDTQNVAGTGRVVDPEGAGGGIRIDGVVCHPNSPLRSMVADAFTQVNQGGPGHLCINTGYAQFVSCFTTFCTYSFKSSTGGSVNISNSVTDFGLYGLVAQGYWPDPFTTATVVSTATSSLLSVPVTAGGEGYSSPPTVSFSGGGGTGAAATAQLDGGGRVASVVLTATGSGYTSAPTVTFTGGGGSGAVGAALLAGTGPVAMQFPTYRRPDIGSVAFFNGQWRTVMGASAVDDATHRYEVTLFPEPAYATEGVSVPFHTVSSVCTGSHVMEYVGAGVTYNALPEYGGVPVAGNEVLEEAPGRCFYTTSDHLGNNKLGKFFQIEQSTGCVGRMQWRVAASAAVGPCPLCDCCAGDVSADGGCARPCSHLHNSLHRAPAVPGPGLAAGHGGEQAAAGSGGAASGSGGIGGGCAAGGGGGPCPLNRCTIITVSVSCHSITLLSYHQGQQGAETDGGRGEDDRRPKRAGQGGHISLSHKSRWLLTTVGRGEALTTAAALQAAGEA